MLNKLGLKCDIVENGIQAIFNTQKNNYDIIFMDINMPEKGGIEVTKNIRECHFLGKIIAMTANDNIDNYQQLGFNSLITKPFSINSIKSALSNVV